MIHAMDLVQSMCDLDEKVFLQITQSLVVGLHPVSIVPVVWQDLAT